MKIAVFVVAYNAVSTLRKVLDRIPVSLRSRLSEIFVFDDSSDDDTYLVGVGYKTVHPDFPNLNIYRNSKNLGYGGNQKQGYRYVIDKGYDIAVLLHGDGQYAPEVMEDLITPIEKGEADAVFGSRMMKKGEALKGHMPLYKYVGNRILTSFENYMLEMNLTEFHSGYRAYRVSALREIPFEHNTNDFHFDTQIIIQLFAKKFRIVEVPIPTYYGSEICRVNGIRYAFDCARSVLRFKMHQVGMKFYDEYNLGQVHYGPKFDKWSSHSKVAALIPPREQKILDVGSHEGVVLEKIKGVNNTLVAVEKEKIEEKPLFLSEVFQKDLDVDFNLPFKKEFDFILFLDVLEHLKDPQGVLTQAADYLKEGGRIVISVPNVAHWTVRLLMLFGHFDYASKGILDRSHLRFFTHSSARHLIMRSGFKIIREEVTPIPLPDIFPIFRNPFFGIFHSLSYLLSKLWKGLFAYQFIFVGERDAPQDPGQLIKRG